MSNIQINDFEIGNTLPLTIIGGVNVLESDQLCSEVANTFVDLSKKHSFNFIFKEFSSSKTPVVYAPFVNIIGIFT